MYHCGQCLVLGGKTEEGKVWLQKAADAGFADAAGTEPQAPNPQRRAYGEALKRLAGRRIWKSVFVLEECRSPCAEALKRMARRYIC
jgi:hypothetical protein